VPFSSTSGKCLDFVCIPNEYYQNRNWIIKWKSLDKNT
jgi:hypothetical protein